MDIDSILLRVEFVANQEDASHFTILQPIFNFDFRVDPTLCTSAAAKAAELAQQNDSSCSIQVNYKLKCKLHYSNGKRFQEFSIKSLI